jgi:hypothetical protein
MLLFSVSVSVSCAALCYVAGAPGACDMLLCAWLCNMLFCDASHLAGVRRCAALCCPLCQIVAVLTPLLMPHGCC